MAASIFVVTFTLAVDPRIKLLARLNAVILTLLTLTWLYLGGNWLARSQLGFLYHPELHVSSAGDVIVSAPNDGPYVLTHLACYGDGDKRVAAFDPPIGLFDSNGVRIGAASIRKMNWLDARGHKTMAPPVNSNLRVLYFTPESLEVPSSE